MNKTFKNNLKFYENVPSLLNTLRAQNATAMTLKPLRPSWKAYGGSPPSSIALDRGGIMLLEFAGMKDPSAAVEQGKNIYDWNKYARHCMIGHPLVSFNAFGEATRLCVWFGKAGHVPSFENYNTYD